MTHAPLYRRVHDLEARLTDDVVRRNKKGELL